MLSCKSKKRCIYMRKKETNIFWWGKIFTKDILFTFTNRYEKKSLKYYQKEESSIILYKLTFPFRKFNIYNTNGSFLISTTVFFIFLKNESIRNVLQLYISYFHYCSFLQKGIFCNILLFSAFVVYIRLFCVYMEKKRK